ncbi:hypothetical protein A2W12_04125 [Candidatus Nomurabacteria bacterium RBG_16_40_11]|nr:MAG: hypothetical protein A2W12_04125 [Candidatus Nomurabacteria bacterium RBG_16_40_11]
MCHARSAWLLETKSYARRKPRHRLASLGKTEKQFFWGKRIFRFASALFSPAERGLGNECERTSVFKKFAHKKEKW